MGPRAGRPLAPEVVDEVRAQLAQLDVGAPRDAEERERWRAAASRLAAIFRREARAGRGLLALADPDDGELEPELRARLAALCRRRA